VAAEVSKIAVPLHKKIPVIAAGGIYNGEDIYKFFKLGARGIQMGTRFVATNECDADYEFKKAYLHCKEEDIVIIKSPVGLPGRAIKNTFLREVESGTSKGVRCPWRCLESCNAKHARYCISEALDNARQGKLDHGFAFAGANAYRVEGIVPVKLLIKELKNEYFRIVEDGTVNIRTEFDHTFKRLMELRNQYVKAVKKSVKSLKAEVSHLVDEKTIAFQERYQHAMARLDCLKDEYAAYFTKVKELREQLSRFLDTSSIKVPTTAIFWKAYFFSH
jgi:hypothetical protein